LEFAEPRRGDPERTGEDVFIFSPANAAPMTSATPPRLLTKPSIGARRASISSFT
jgi:hypothetical protein